MDINGRIGRKVLARYVSISKIGNTLNLEQTGGSYKEGDIMILYGGGLNGPTSTIKHGVEFMSTIQVFVEPATFGQSSAYMQYHRVAQVAFREGSRKVKELLNLIDQKFQNMFSEEPSPRTYKITSTHENCTAIAEILNYYNKSDKSTYENGHPVIIEVPKKGDKTLKEVLGPVSGGKKYKESKVNNCVHTGALTHADKPKIRKFGDYEMAMLIDFINSKENKDIMEKNKKLAFYLYQDWPRC